MVAPRVPEKYKSGGVGRSFRGTALYLLHDADHASTDERVAWTDVQNLSSDDPEMAWRMMAGTAMDAQNIQRAYHEANGDPDTPFRAAKRSFNHVFHYSLSWRGEDEALTVTRDDMMESARASLKELGGADLQAMFICHNDTEQPHVHIMVNRVHPETGRIVPVDSNAKRALSRWARGFEKDRDMIVCPERERRAQLREAGIKHPSYDRAFPRQYRNERAVADAVKAAPDMARKLREEQAQADREIHKSGLQMRRTHETQWDTLKRDHGFRKRMINDEADDAKNSAERQIHAGYAQTFEAQWKRQGEQRAQFEDNERRALGAVRNTLQAVKSIIGEEGRSAADKVRDTFQVMGNAGARLAQLGRQHQRENAALRGALKRDVCDARQRLESTRKAAISDNYHRYETERETLRDSQAQDRAIHKSAWRERDNARLEAWRMFSERVDASANLKQAYEEAKDISVELRRRKSEDAQRSEADALRRGDDRTSRGDFDIASGESPAEWAKAKAKSEGNPKKSADDAFKSAAKADKPRPSTPIDGD